jgi:GNAT superfamily N-acetyltransferase
MNTSKIMVRPITAADLEAVITLDRRISGQSRRGFYVKRFAAAKEAPNAFVWLAAVDGEQQLAGFISGHILDGEFGGTAPTAVIDAIGTTPDMRGKGIGQALMAAFDAAAKARRVTEVYSEVDWTDHGLARFFAAAGFRLAPQVVLECPTATDF